MIKRLFASIMFLAAPGLSQAIPLDDHPYLSDMADRLVAEHGFDRARLVEIFDGVTLRPQVVEAITRPAERLPWHRYRSFFITPSQIRNGVEFWSKHEDVLERAARESGVPPEIIVAVIGIETRYGTTLGSHPVLDSLTTLTLQYPRRREFFGAQLEHFLLLAEEHGLDPLAIRGSYAGAIGIPQFMPSSYRDYAVDFSGDGKADLVNQTEDAIGSVANYLRRFDWQAGHPITTRIPPDAVPASTESNQKRPNTTIQALRAKGVNLDVDLADDHGAGVVSLEGDDGMLHWIAFENFYVLMRYNPSVLYASAVSELSKALREARAGGWRQGD